MRTHGSGCQEIESTTVGMCQRQEREYLVSFLQQSGTDAESDISRKIVSRQHDAFAEAGGSRSIVQQHHLVVGQCGVFDVFPAEAFRIIFVHLLIDMFKEPIDGFAIALVQAAEVGKGKHGTQSGKTFFFQVFPNGIAGEEEYGFGVVDDVVYVVRIEILEYGDYDGTIRDCGHVGDAPAGVVFAYDGDFVTAA